MNFHAKRIVSTLCALAMLAAMILHPLPWLTTP